MVGVKRSHGELVSTAQSGLVNLQPKKNPLLLTRFIRSVRRTEGSSLSATWSRKISEKKIVAQRLSI